MINIEGVAHDNAIITRVYEPLFVNWKLTRKCKGKFYFKNKNGDRISFSLNSEQLPDADFLKVGQEYLLKINK